MEKILELLDEYRKYPRFQLERHFDVILLEYIPKILNAYFKKSNKKRIYSIAFPEFPISKLLVKDESSNPDDSVSVDYIAFDKINKKFCFVELKTDIGSDNPKQNKYLNKVNALEYDEILNFVKKRAKRTDKKSIKFNYLMHKLIEEGITNNADSPPNELSFAPDGVIKIIPKDTKSEKHNFIEFKDIASYKIIKDGFDLVIKYLSRWIESPEQCIKNQIGDRPKIKTKARRDDSVICKSEIDDITREIKRNYDVIKYGIPRILQIGTNNGKPLNRPNYQVEFNDGRVLTFSYFGKKYPKSERFNPKKLFKPIIWEDI